jgi:hypothetical protein
MNDLAKPLYSGSDLFVFADDCKLHKFMLDAKDDQTVQSDLNALKNWVDCSSHKLNIDKCKLVPYGRNFNTERLSALTIS